MVEPTGNIVKKYFIGNTDIEIRDSAYINRTPLEIEKGMERIMNIGWRCVQEARNEGKDI